MLFCRLFVKNNEKYSDTVAIIGYTEEVEPFIYSVNDGNADGFIPDLWSNIFDSVKGDLKSYRFEKIDSDYVLEEDGGFVDGSGKEYSACLLMGAVRKMTEHLIRITLTASRL